MSRGTSSKWVAAVGASSRRMCLCVFVVLPRCELCRCRSRGGSIKQLRPFVNLTDSDFVLFVAVLADALGTVGPHPIALFLGEEGSAKSTLTKIVRLLVDPAEVPATTLSVSVEDLFVKVHSAQMLAFDNVSDIPLKVSVALSQIVSGSGLERRKRYTDSELFSVGGMRSIVMNGLANPITQPDLAERAIIFPVLKIKAEDRCLDVEFWRRFEAERPMIFGALLDVVAHGLNGYRMVRVSRPPRMADFVYFGCACETAFAEPEAFLAALAVRTAEAVEDVIDANPVAKAVAAFMHPRKVWRGTATQLLMELTVRDPAELTPSASRDWPKDSTRFSTALRNHSALLRKVGIEIDFDERTTDRRRDRMLELRRVTVEPTVGNALRTLRTL